MESNLAAVTHRGLVRRCNEDTVTVAGLLLTGDEAFTLDVGDSRCYVSSGPVLEQVSTDDSAGHRTHVVDQLEAAALRVPDPRQDAATQLRWALDAGTPDLVFLVLAEVSR